MNFTIVLIIVVVGIALYVISTFNWFQTAKTRIRASIQEIGNQLKRQADLIPNLEESVKGYLKHEKGIFAQLTDARKAIAAAQGNMSKAASATTALSKVIPALQVIVESNPELKADTTVRSLMDELRDTADKVMYARRTLIDLVADYNQRIITIPSNFVANAFGFKEEKGLTTPMEGAHLSVSGEEMKSPKVKLE